MLPESVDCRKNPWICRFILNIFYKILYLVAITSSIFGVLCRKVCVLRVLGLKKGLILCQIHSIIQVHFTYETGSRRHGKRDTGIYCIFT